jgi:hypothetical protein
MNRTTSVIVLGVTTVLCVYLMLDNANKRAALEAQIIMNEQQLKLKNLKPCAPVQAVEVTVDGTTA